MTEYIVKVENLAKLRELAGLHVKETIELTSGKIVRCMDCKFRCLDECTRIDEGFKDYWFAIEPDGFCSFGERKEGGE